MMKSRAISDDTEESWASSTAGERSDVKKIRRWGRRVGG